MYLYFFGGGHIFITLELSVKHEDSGCMYQIRFILIFSNWLTLAYTLTACINGPTLRWSLLEKEVFYCVNK